MPEFHAGGGAGEQVDLELLACLGPTHQLARDELGIAGGEAGDEQVGAVADVLGRGAGIGDLVGERGVTDAWVHGRSVPVAWERPAAGGVLAGCTGTAYPLREAVQRAQSDGHKTGELCLQQAPLQECLHVAAAVGNHQHINFFDQDLVDDAVGFEKK